MKQCTDTAQESTPNRRLYCHFSVNSAFFYSIFYKSGVQLCTFFKYLIYFPRFFFFWELQYHSRGGRWRRRARFSATRSSLRSANEAEEDVNNNSAAPRRCGKHARVLVSRAQSRSLTLVRSHACEMCDSCFSAFAPRRAQTGVSLG